MRARFLSLDPYMRGRMADVKSYAKPVDLGAVTAIDEKITGCYRPDEWERRVGYYLRRDPDAAEAAAREHVRAALRERLKRLFPETES